MTAISEIVVLIDYDVKLKFGQGQADTGMKLFLLQFVVFNVRGLLRDLRGVA
jgi:hypothetical protein